MVAINNAQRSRRPVSSGGIDYGTRAASSTAPDDATDRDPAPRPGSDGLMWFVDFAAVALVGLISAAGVLALMLLAASCVLV